MNFTYRAHNTAGLLNHATRNGVFNVGLKSSVTLKASTNLEIENSK